jgi:ribosomal protein L9
MSDPSPTTHRFDVSNNRRVRLRIGAAAMGAGIVVFAYVVLYGNAIAAPMEYAVDGVAVGTQLNFDSASYREYKCSPSDQFDGLTWCQKTRSDKERRRSYIAAYSLLHSRDGNILYINRTQEPAFLNPKEVEVNIQRYSRKIGESPRIMKMPHRGSLPDGLIAVWGKITLEPLDQESIKTLADGRNPRKGFLIDYLRDFTRSAKQGLPIFRINGGPGFIWAASFDQKERGTLRLAAVELSGFSPSSDPAPVVVETTAQTPPSDPAPIVVETTAQTPPSDPAPVVVETTAQTPPSDPAPIVVEATVQTDQEQLPSELSQTVENLRADLAISINKIAELEKAKAEAERAAEQAEQAKLDAENAKQEVERARIAERMTSNALVAQVRADKVAAGAKSGRWENALYGSIGGLIVVLTALAIGFLMNRHKASVWKQPVWKLGTKPIETSPHCQKSEAALEPSALSPEIAIATNAAGWGDMIRKTISCALAGLLTVVSAVAFLSGLLGYWDPSSVVVLSLIFGFTIGVMWLGSEVVGDFPGRTMSPYMGPMASATKVHVESDHCDTKSAARKPTKEGGSHCLATTAG